MLYLVITVKKREKCLKTCCLLYLQLRDEDLPKDMQESNWFSAPSALRVYGQYLNLDKDHNGMLSKEELARLGYKFHSQLHVHVYDCIDILIFLVRIFITPPMVINDHYHFSNIFKPCYYLLPGGVLCSTFDIQCDCMEVKL